MNGEMLIEKKRVCTGMIQSSAFFRGPKINVIIIVYNKGN